MNKLILQIFNKKIKILVVLLPGFQVVAKVSSCTWKPTQSDVLDEGSGVLWIYWFTQVQTYKDARIRKHNTLQFYKVFE